MRIYPDCPIITRTVEGAQLFIKANEFSLEMCPLELGPHLEYLDQPEGYSGNASQQNKAPSGPLQ